MSCMMMPEKSLAMLADTITSVLNHGYNNFGFSAPASLYDALDDCRGHYGDFHVKDVYTALFLLNQSAYTGRYKEDCAAIILDVPNVPRMHEPREGRNNHDVVKPWHFHFCKLLDFLVYQCNEDATYQTPLFNALCDMANTVSSFIVRNMDEYDAIGWGC